jgi:hypothetical protein
MNQPNGGVSGFQKFKLWTCGPIILGGLLLIGAAFVGMVLLLGHDSFHPPMDKKEAANILMQTLRAGNYGKALEILGRTLRKISAATQTSLNNGSSTIISNQKAGRGPERSPAALCQGTGK